MQQGRAGNKDCWFTESFESVVDDINALIGEDVKRLYLPMGTEDRAFYISASGCGFVAKPLCGRVAVVTAAWHKQSKRNSTPCFQFTVSKGLRKMYKVALCVFNAFSRGRWSDLPVEHKDGNVLNVALDNLREPMGEREIFRDEQLDVYPREFKRLVRYLVWRFTIGEQQAEDIVQDQYLYTHFGGADRINAISDQVRLWADMSIKRAKDAVVHSARYPNFDPTTTQCLLSNYEEEDPFPKIDLAVISNKKQRRLLELYLAGYDYKELAAIVGYKDHKSVSTAMMSIKRIIKKEML